jgi:thiopurine S-methyltransferase
MSANPPLPPSENTAEYWEAVYRDDAPNGRPRWDIGDVAPPLARVIASGMCPVAPPAEVLVPGCGTGNDVAFLAAQGFGAVGVDWAEAGVAAARERLASWPHAAVERADFFALPQRDDFRESFELVVEHTFFVAIDPSRRADYAAVIEAVLRRREGWYLGLFYNHRRPGGPPFDATEEAIRATFARPGWQLVHWEMPEDSVPHRQGKEWLGLWRVTRPRLLL